MFSRSSRYHFCANKFLVAQHSGRERCAMASSDDSSEEATFDEQMASIEFAELLANLERMPGVSQTSELEASETGE